MQDGTTRAGRYTTATDATDQVSGGQVAGEVTNHELEGLRARLDDIDERLLDTLRQRIECCVAIAHVKRAHDVPMMQPHRIGLVHRRAAAYADAHGIDGDFLRRLYDLVIEETCRVEDAVIGTVAGTARG